MRFAIVTIGLSLAVALPNTASGASPPGGYQNTCRDIEVQNLLGGPGQSLVANCLNQSGRFAKTSLPLPCTGDIQNRNGRLICVAGSNPYAPPRGSYTGKCRRTNMAGPILQAECMTVLRSYVKTSINVLTCKGRDIDVGPKGGLFCR